MAAHPRAGEPTAPSDLCNIAQLIGAYYRYPVDASASEKQVSFGTSGHRGRAGQGSFNEAHIVAIVQAICDYRRSQHINGPLFIGKDTHALSEAAFLTAMEVLAAQDIPVCYAPLPAYTPTPVISHAILSYNRCNQQQADGIVITPSHNPPQDGGIKYNPPSGGPAGTDTTDWIAQQANAWLQRGIDSIARLPYPQALQQQQCQCYDFLNPYIRELKEVVDMERIRHSGLKLAADALGGSAGAYWEAIAEHYQLNLEVHHQQLDATFAFMHLDHDAAIRMDCSSPWAMSGLLALKDNYDVAFANDPDADRHGIVVPKTGLMNPNHYLAVAVDYLLRNRSSWLPTAGVGKTLVSSSLIDRVVENCGRSLVEVPVGFKWFVNGLLDGSLVFGGEESAGAAFVRQDGTPWVTDKDGIVLSLLAAEITAVTGEDPGHYYQRLTQQLGEPYYARLDVSATPQQKACLKNLSPADLQGKTLAGDPIKQAVTQAPGNGAPIGGIKAVTAQGWFAARPSGTEDIYKIYTESFQDQGHLQQIQDDAQKLLQQLFAQG